MGVVIDYSHEQMVGNQPADGLYLLKRMGVPVMVSINAKYSSNDESRHQDRRRSVWPSSAAAIDTDYRGWFGEDQFTYRMGPVKAMLLSKGLFASMKGALRIYAVGQTRRCPGDRRCRHVIDIVKRILTGN